MVHHFIVLKMLNKDNDIYSVCNNNNNNNNRRNPKGMSFSILAESCNIIEIGKLFECFVLELIKFVI